jgi:ubiquitin-protein ligase
MPSLPESIWRRRLESEFEEMSESSIDFKANPEKTEYTVRFSKKALQKKGSSITPIFNHLVKIILKRDFPYPNSVEVFWLSPIFHPNIAPDGRVCIQLLNKWSENQTVKSIVLGLEQLLDNPNPLSPLNREAAEYFSNPKPKVVGNQ